MSLGQKLNQKHISLEALVLLGVPRKAAERTLKCWFLWGQARTRHTCRCSWQGRCSLGRVHGRWACDVFMWYLTSALGRAGQNLTPAQWSRARAGPALGGLRTHFFCWSAWVLGLWDRGSWVREKPLWCVRFGQSPRGEGTVFHDWEMAEFSANLPTCQEGGSGTGRPLGNDTCRATRRKKTVLFEVEEEG